MASLKQQALDLLEETLAPTPKVFLIGTLVVLLLPVLLHFLIVRSSPYTSPPTILLAGPSSAGKTALLTRLERGDVPAQTHTSQRAHTVELTSPSSSASRASLALALRDTESKHTKFLVVDIPGHGKLRSDALSRFSPAALADAKARGVVFVVDAAALSDQDYLAAAGGYLYDVLLALQRRTAGIKTSKIPGAIPVLVAANKGDLFTALPAALVKSTLEAEISRVRASRSKGLLDSGVGGEEVGGEEADAWLGAYGTEKFGFEQMKEFNVDVEVVGGNVLGEGPGVDKWWKWMADKV